MGTLVVPIAGSEIAFVVDYLIIIISLLMSPLLGHRPSLWITYKENELENHHADPVRVGGWNIIDYLSR
jgi:hypothetical protein